MQSQVPGRSPAATEHESDFCRPVGVDRSILSLDSEADLNEVSSTAFQLSNMLATTKIGPGSFDPGP